MKEKCLLKARKDGDGVRGMGRPPCGISVVVPEARGRAMIGKLTKPRSLIIRLTPGGAVLGGFRKRGSCGRTEEDLRVGE